MDYLDCFECALSVNKEKCSDPVHSFHYTILVWSTLYSLFGQGDVHRDGQTVYVT